MRKGEREGGKERKCSDENGRNEIITMRKEGKEGEKEML